MTLDVFALAHRSGPDHADVLPVLQTLGSVYADLEDFDRAASVLPTPAMTGTECVSRGLLVMVRWCTAF